MKTTQSYLLPDLADIFRRENAILREVRDRILEEKDALIEADTTVIERLNNEIEALTAHQNRLEGRRQELVREIATAAGMEPGRAGRHTTLVIVTASMERQWVEALRSLTQRGVKAAVILLDQESFGGRAGAVEVEMELRAAGIQVNRVRAGDYLPDVLSVQRGSARAAGMASERVTV